MGPICHDLVSYLSLFLTMVVSDTQHRRLREMSTATALKKLSELHKMETDELYCQMIGIPQVNVQQCVPAALMCLLTLSLHCWEHAQVGFITIHATETRIHTDMSDTVLKNNQSQLLDDLVAFHMQVSHPYCRW